jgi:peptidoglycan/LPS O-acetylase OafA/YrhL
VVAALAQRAEVGGLGMSGNFSDGSVGQYRPDIDGLRAIAITAVVAFHAGLKGVTGGFIGVDIFFVLSGFLITSMLFKEAELTGKINLQEFYARRVRRLLPASSLVLVVTIILAYFFLIPIGDEQLKFARSAIATAFFVSNIYFWKSSGGYFDGPSDQIPLLHTWSLSVEEQFYLVWPILLIGIVRFAILKGLKLRNLVLLTLAVMFTGSLGTSIWLSAESPSAGFYLLPSRIWELAAGAMAGVFLYKRGLNKSLNARWFAEFLSLAGLSAIIIGIIYFDATMTFPGWVALLPVSGTVAVVIAGSLSYKNSVSRMLSTKPMVWIGKLSYSWYLWHWPLLVFTKINNFGHSDLSINLVIVFFALLLAFLTYYFVENPIRHNKPWAFKTQKGSLNLGAGMMVFAVATVVSLLAVRTQAQETVLSKQVDYAYLDFSPLRFTCSRNGSNPLEVLNKTACEMGNKTAAETIVVWGDSHSDHWMPLLVDYFKNYRIIQYSMPGCPPLIGNANPHVENCRAFNDLVAESIKLNTSVKGVILAARWSAYTGSPAIQNKQKSDSPIYFDASATSTEDALSILNISLERTLKTINTNNLKILVMGATPEFKYPVPACVFRKSPEYCQSTRAENDIYREKVMKVLRDTIAKQPGVRLADGYEALCDSQYCPVVKNERIFYSDGDHLTGSGAKHTLSSMQTEFAWFAQSQPK